MKKMGIIYGSSTGTCESIAQTIAEKLGVASVDVIDASKITTEKVESYDILLLGTSTWGDGELQDDWYDAIKMIKTADLNGKIVALFGCGDSESYCDTFCDGMGVIYDQFLLQDGYFQLPCHGYTTALLPHHPCFLYLLKSPYYLCVPF